MKRSLLVVIVVALFVVQPATAASYPSAEAACGQTGGGESLIAIFPGATQLQDDDSQVVTHQDSPVGVYSGTEFRVALCKNGELKHTRGSEWSLESSPGLTVTDRSDATVTVRVTDGADRIDVGAKNKDLPAISFAVQRAATAEVGVGDEPITLTFENQSAADEYAAVEERYRSARENLTAATQRLNQSAAALRSGEKNASGATETVLPLVSTRSDAVETRAATVKAELYEIAWGSQRNSKALTAISAVETDQRVAETDARNAMDNYLAALQAAERNAQLTVLFNLGGAAILGLVAGAVPGWWLTKQKLEGVRFDQEVNSSVSYGPRLLARAGGLAVVALLVTLAALVALGGLGKFGGLL